MDPLKGVDPSFSEGYNVRIEVSPKVGRYLVACKDFEQKETIFEELPLVTAPSGQLDFEEESGAYYCVCTACFLSLKEVDEDKVYDCPVCGWPFCSEDCAVGDVYHKEMECSIFGEKEISQNPETIQSVYFIRSLCLSRREEDNGREDGRWRKIRDLTANFLGDGLVQKCSEKDVAIYEFLRDECGICTTAEVIATLNGIRNVNAFQINSSDSGERKYYGMALYHVASIAAHSCHPNVRWQTLMPEEKPGFPMRFQSTTGLIGGDSITIAYRNKCLTIGTLGRREEIQSGHGFICRCLRCEDPSEFETNFSAIRCTRCELGYLLPKIDAAGSDWICRVCKETEPVGYVRDIIDRITGQINKAKEMEECGGKEVCCKLDMIINKYSGRILHPNNYLLIWAQFLWLQFMEHEMYVGKSVGIRHETFILMQLRAKHCNEIYCKFFSTCSKFYGYFERLRGAVLYMYYLNPEVWGKIQDRHNRLRILRKTLEHFQRSLNYDGWESLELELIEIKIKNVKRIVDEILEGKGGTL